jgi:hypothetical protein
VGVHCGIYKGSSNVSTISYLNSPPPPFSFISFYPHLRNSFSRYLFSIYIHVYTVFAPYSPSYTLSTPPPQNAILCFHEYTTASKGIKKKSNGRHQNSFVLSLFSLNQKIIKNYYIYKFKLSYAWLLSYVLYLFSFRFYVLINWKLLTITKMYSFSLLLTYIRTELYVSSCKFWFVQFLIIFYIFMIYYIFN